MQENRDCAGDSSQVSGSGQGDSPSVSLQSSKLRKKLERLARWRIDPSLIEFQEDAPEFHGGFATVSQAFLTSPSGAKGPTIKSENTTDRSADSDAGHIQLQIDTHGPKEDQQGGDDGAHNRTGDPGGGNDNIEDLEEGRKDPDSNEEQKSLHETSMPKIGDDSADSELTRDEDPNSSPGAPESQSNTQEPDGEQQCQEEGMNRQLANNANNQTKEGPRAELENTNEDQDSNHHTSKPKVVAVKKLKIEGDADLERALGLALREAGFLAEISHPNIVRLEGFVEDLSEHKVWLIFPWEEHGNLRDFLASRELEIPEQISLINDVTLGLECLHSQEPPIYHGDLKSLNILVNSECNALITDFGSARHLGDDHVGNPPKENRKPPPAIDSTASEPHITLEALFSTNGSTLTLTGSSYTIRWAAPELLQDEGPCLRSDTWALGWIAYEVMTKTIPFHDVKKDAIVINRVIQGQLPSVTEDARMSLIRALCSLMVQCWSINPDKRPTAEECRKIPMIVPAPNQIIDEGTSQLRRAQVLVQVGQMYRRQSDYVSASKCFTEALNIYTNNNDSEGRADTLCRLADVHRFRGEYTEAVAYYSEALQLSTHLGDESKRCDIIFGLAVTRQYLHELDEAVKLYSESLRISTNTGSKPDKALTLWGLATVHRMQGQHSEATRLYSEALLIHTELGNQKERANTLWGLAEVHRCQFEFRQAIHLYSEALQILTDVGDHQDRAITLWSIADVHRLQGEYSKANQLFSESLQINDNTGNRQGKATALWGLAEVHRVQHQYDEAKKLLSEAAQTFADLGKKHEEVEALFSLAEIAETQEHHTEAISFYTKASEIYVEIENFTRASDALEIAAAIRNRLEDAIEGSIGTAEVEKEPLASSV